MRSRTRSVLGGLAALVALLLALVAIPVALYHFAGNPIPSQLPDLEQLKDALSRPDDGTNLMTALKVVGWLAWATAAIGILYEFVGQLRHTRAPRIPIAGNMVAAVLALTAIGVATAAGPASALPGTSSHIEATRAGITATAPAATHQASSPATNSTHGTNSHSAARTAAKPTPAPHTASAAKPAASHAPAHAHAEVVVHTGDTLSEIAQREYGDANRYPQIFEANKGERQPDGRALTNPDRIYTGWHLSVPANPEAADTTSPAAPAPADATPEAAPAPTSGAAATPTPAPQAGATTSSEGSTADTTPGSTPAVPSPIASSAPAATPSTASPSVAAAPAATPSAAVPSAAVPSAAVPSAAPATGSLIETSSAAVDSRLLAGLGGLAAAGALGLLVLRRARQSSRRRPGQRIALPAGDAAIAEAQLRVAADPLTAAHLDLALRTIAHQATQEQQALPPVRAARITPDTLELYLTDDQDTLPIPFTADPSVPGAWTMPRGQLDELLDPATAAATPAPYPTLVTLGYDENDAYLLINLEEIGSLTITGDTASSHAVLTALAVELIGSGWSDDVRVTLAGVLPELADALASDRVNYVDELGEILTALEYGAGVDRQVMGDADLDNPVQARASRLSSESWTPHLILTSQETDAAARERVDQVMHQVPRLAIATITAGGPAIGEWSLDVTSTHAGEPTISAVLQPAGLQLTPQRLGGPAYQHLLDAFRTNDQDLVDGPAWADTLSDELDLDQLPDVTPHHDANLTLQEDDPSKPSAAAALKDDGRELDVADYIPDTIAALSALDAMGMGAVRAVIDHAGPAPEGDGAARPAPLDSDSVAGRAAPFFGQPSANPTSSDPTSSRRADGPMLRLLGNVEVLQPSGGKTGSPKISSAILTYIALYPGASTQDLDEAIWPGVRKTADERNPVVSRTRNWFGTADDGHPYLGRFDETGDYRMTNDTPCDWFMFRRLVGHSIAKASTQDLVDALRLVQGRPLTGDHRYAVAPWVQGPQNEMIQAIGDVAHEISTRACRDGDPRTAIWASGRGLTIDPANEALWRDTLRAAAQTGDPEQVRETIQRLHTALDPLGQDLEDDTDALLHQLRQRATAAA